jgi:signal transduction histidine kinase
VVAAARGLPPELLGSRHECEILADVPPSLLQACGRFAAAHTLPMVAGGDLFGALVLLFERAAALDAERLRLVEAIVDLAAVALSQANRYEELRRAYDELRASREVLARSQKLRSLGQMAAGIAHDLKNLLNPLSLQVQILKRRIGRERPDAVELAAQMDQVIVRGIETVERLRDFSRQAPEAKAVAVDVNPLVAEAVALAGPRLPSRSPTQITFEPGAPPRVEVQPSELITAIVNLLVNAIDARPSGGSIALRTEARDGSAVIVVADDGPGMSPEVERRVFEPFFTTKGEEGTGLGLAMVYAFVNRSGGTIGLETAPGRGTTFTLRFPEALARTG